jgi:hypothetical protein
MKGSTMKNTSPEITQLIWEILNSAIFDLTKGDFQDGINAIEEVITILENKP